MGFTVNLHRINGIRSNMLVTMVTLQMAINSDLTSIKSWLLKNLLLAKTKTKKYNLHLYFYLLHKHIERRFLFSVFVLYYDEEDEFFMFYVYMTELCRESFDWRAINKTIEFLYHCSFFPVLGI